MKLKIRTYQDTTDEARHTTVITSDIDEIVSNFNPIHGNYWIVTLNKMTRWYHVDDSRLIFVKYEVQK